MMTASPDNDSGKRVGSKMKSAGKTIDTDFNINNSNNDHGDNHAPVDSDNNDESQPFRKNPKRSRNEFSQQQPWSDSDDSGPNKKKFTSASPTTTSTKDKITGWLSSPKNKKTANDDVTTSALGTKSTGSAKGNTLVGGVATSAIPKKKPINTENGASSSLLANLQPVKTEPGSTTTMTTSKKPGDLRKSSKGTNSNTVKKSPQPTTLESTAITGSTNPTGVDTVKSITATASLGTSKPNPQSQGSSQTSGSATPTAKSHSNLSGPDRLILEKLTTLCNHYSKDFRFQVVPPSKGGIDLYGSFLRRDTEESLDFFDLNEKGELILHPRPPIFPEEFPPGMKEHPLHWWGVLDPVIGDGKHGSNRIRTPVPNSVHQNRTHPERRSDGSNPDNDGKLSSKPGEHC